MTSDRNNSVKISNHWDSFLPDISASILKSNYAKLLARSIYSVDEYKWRYERCISKLGHEIYVDKLQTVSVNVNDAHRCKMNGWTGQTAGISWIPDWAFIIGNVYIIKIQQIQKKEKRKKKKKKDMRNTTSKTYQNQCLRTASSKQHGWELNLKDILHCAQTYQTTDV